MLVRKCALCGREIEVSLPYDNSYVYYGTKQKWYCTDCFTAMTTPRILKNDWFAKTKAYVTQEVSKDNIDRLFKRQFGLVYVPKYIYIKLQSIYDGTFKGLTQPIPPNELLDILERKQAYIDKRISENGISEDISKINYALAVAAGSYKSYKEWLSRCAAEKELAKQTAQKRKDRDIALKGYVPPDEPEREAIIIEDDDY